MKKIMASDKIYVKKSKINNAGRGVFAKKDIRKGDVIENCPFIEISEDDTKHLGESFLVSYFFYFGKNKARSGIVLGFGSIYNHSDSPNATFDINEKGKLINFIAIHNIKKDSEITFDYNHGNPKESPLWFEV